MAWVAALTRVCHEGQHIVCTGCRCNCHNRQIPANFRELVRARERERDAEREAARAQERIPA